MQTIGYVEVHGEQIKVLVREGVLCRYFKVRKTGKVGTKFQDESIHLEGNPKTFQLLKNGGNIVL